MSLVGRNNHAPLDWWSLGHVAVGALGGAVGLSGSQMLGASVAWEIVEYPFTRETPRNVVADIATFMFGWGIYAVLKRG